MVVYWHILRVACLLQHKYKMHVLLLVRYSLFIFYCTVYDNQQRCVCKSIFLALKARCVVAL